MLLLFCLITVKKKKCMPRNLFFRILKEEGICPMCGENVDYRRLVKIDDVSLYLEHNSSEWVTVANMFKLSLFFFGIGLFWQFWQWIVIQVIDIIIPRHGTMVCGSHKQYCPMWNLNLHFNAASEAKRAPVYPCVLIFHNINV